jgi:hypothetical protein
MMRVYTVITVDNYIPKIALTTLNREDAIAYAKEYAKDWGNEQHRASDEVYFNQREDGSMEYAVTVQESELPTPSVDQSTRAQIIDVAEAILWNDGIEEYPAELIAFAREAIGVPESQQPDARVLKAATHAAFGAMLLGLPIKEAVNRVLTNRSDILEEAH